MQQGITLMVVGMGVVFCFLILMVFAVQAMGSILQNIVPPEPEPQPRKSKANASTDVAMVVAVAAAQRYRLGK